MCGACETGGRERIAPAAGRPERTPRPAPLRLHCLVPNARKITSKSPNPLPSDPQHPVLAETGRSRPTTTTVTTTTTTTTTTTISMTTTTTGRLLSTMDRLRGNQSILQTLLLNIANTFHGEWSRYMTTLVVISLCLIIITSYYYLIKNPREQQGKSRFRKRDKIMFYGRRFIRRLRKIKRKQLKKLTKNAKPPIVWTGNTNDLNKTVQAYGYSAVALFPNSYEVPLNSFCRELKFALTAQDNVLHLNADFVIEQLGSSAFEESKQHLLTLWLAQMEKEYKIVLYQCDYGMTPWTKLCLKQAKCILVVAMAHLEPTLTSLEHQLYSFNPQPAPIELILLHKCDTKKPKHTTAWLSLRNWCQHHHLRCPQRVLVRKRTKIEDIYSELSKTSPKNDNDFARMARYLTGKSVGLVLGGGGARGIAHMGMIKALLKANMPIDMIGGVSIGAFVGALWAQEADLTPVTQLARNWCYKMTSLWHQILDLTYPATAMFTGAAFNRTIHEVFGDRQIEDLWLPFFTVTTDITDSAPRIHRHGSLWRYVRSSMSLSGYLPPLCDPIDGHLLLDGGYVNNLPADVMHTVMGAKTILAVDVGSQDETDLFNYGDTLNGWWHLWNRWNPFGQNIRVPSLPEIQSRLAYVSCVRQLEEVKRSKCCSYIRPPIDQFKTMQFGSFDLIFEIGYQHGRALFPDEKVAKKTVFDPNTSSDGKVININNNNNNNNNNNETSAYIIDSKENNKSSGE